MLFRPWAGCPSTTAPARPSGCPLSAGRRCFAEHAGDAQLAMQSRSLLHVPARCWLLPLVLALVVHAPLDSHAAQHRRLLIRPYPLGQAKCRNTIAGPLFYADDTGSVCGAKEFDYSSGCCNGGQKHSCDKCNPTDKCCESYEHCVSCCMAPASSPDTLMKQIRTVRGDPSSPLWPDTFEFCRFYCRTHGRSTSHENAYIAPRHHCFSKLGKPLVDPPLPTNALEGVQLVMGAAGASCEATCAASSSTCSPQHLKLVNSCDRLRELVNCEAGCVTEGQVPTMPYYVDGEAPKPSRPALCVVANKNTTAEQGKEASCSGSTPHQRRLCPCKKAQR